MELSDGDDECNDHESHIVSSDFKQDEKRNPTNSVQKQIASQIISESVVYNNHPQIYQSYYQNGSQMFQGQNIETGRLLALLSRALIQLRNFFKLVYYK